MELAKLIYKAGVVGAGGAGFPTHVKANSKVDYILANGAECEPLIHKDYELMVNFSNEIVAGMELMLENTNAKLGYFGIKEKNSNAVANISKHLNSNIKMCLLGDYYPAGDEYELVYEATGRLIPPHGIPLDVGCVVNNVETYLNIYKANKNIPLTDKFVSVTGLVKNPCSVFVPIGTSFKELIKIAGGETSRDFAIYVSGILMGRLTYDLDEPVTKTTAGIILLPINHYLINRMNKPKESMNRIGKSACDQCSYCTEFCPRYLLGYDVQPHKVMRSLVFTTSGKELWNQYADLCCACGLCSLYSCPEDLYPREACIQSKEEMKQQNMKYNQTKPVKIHPIKEGRRVPIKQLLKRLDLEKFERKTPFVDLTIDINEVKILTKQHVGAPSIVMVKAGDKVIKGDLIIKNEEGKLGANIHASINGKIKEVANNYVIISKD
ncbi:MAG TPA: 4Fe-4S dicluster domain-containing protein [Melioribacteraceae bacterium]|nr:4Fe-4S dicluster domain-containing protein [Melioribacteraceae bacterium]